MEVIGLLWEEVNLEKCLIVVRAERGKYVFPSRRVKGQPIGGNAFAPLLSAGKVTSHGFRATFRIWGEDHGMDEAVLEHTLAHQLTDSVQKAYRRGSAVERRREVMQSWADHLGA